MALRRIPKDMSYRSIRHGTAPARRAEDSPPAADEADAPASSIERGHEEQVETPAADPAAPPLSSDPEETPKKRPSKDAPGKPATRREGSGKTVRVRGYVYVPQTPRFEEFVDIYGDHEALKLCITSSLIAYEAALTDTKPLGRPPRFEKAGAPIETARIMPAEAYANAVEHVDPMAVMGKFQLGTRIFNVALSYYLAGE
jgi:hypothetical protein